ncbi:MAG: M23 family metallopeptidase [Chloroflexi bacterium]|nr:M23 family metallopeptidase [Chloroflexota bacterium]
MSGAHLYAIYAHLSAIQVSEGLDLPPNTVIGTCGNTGNSTASHLHLEIRASFNASDPNWTGMRPNLMDPGVLYLAEPQTP